MTLGYLKKSLQKFTGDFQNLEIIIISINSITGEKEYDILSFVGYSENIPSIIIGGAETIKKLAQEGTPGIDGNISISLAQAKMIGAALKKLK